MKMDEACLGTSPQAAKVHPVVTARTPCDLGDASLASCFNVGVSILFYQSFS